MNKDKRVSQLSGTSKYALLATTALMIGGATLAPSQSQATEAPFIVIAEDGATETNSLNIQDSDATLPTVVIFGNDVTFINDGSLFKNLSNSGGGFASSIVFFETVNGSFVNNGVVSVTPGVFSGGIGDGVDFFGAEFELLGGESAGEIARLEADITALLGGDGRPVFSIENNGRIDANFDAINIEDALGDILITNTRIDGINSRISADSTAINISGQFGSTTIDNAGSIFGVQAINISHDVSLESSEHSLTELAASGAFADLGLSLEALRDIGLFDDREISIVNRTGGLVLGELGIEIDLTHDFSEMSGDIGDFLDGDLPGVNVNIVNEEGAVIIGNEGAIDISGDGFFAVSADGEVLNAEGRVSILNDGGIMSDSNNRVAAIDINLIPEIEFTNNNIVLAVGEFSNALRFSNARTVTIENTDDLRAVGGTASAIALFNIEDFSLNNTGVIEGEQAGLLLTFGDTVDVVNSGLIQASDPALFLNNAVVIALAESVNFLNGADGQIQAHGTGLGFIASTTVNAVNDGLISSVDGDVLLFAVDADDVQDFAFTNSGTIESTIVGVSHISPNIESGSSVINNTGLIGGNDAFDLDFGVDIAFVNSVDINNSGQVDAEIAGLSTVFASTANVENSGVINVGLNRSEKTGAFIEAGVLFLDVGDAALTNSGLIQAAEDFRVGVQSQGVLSFSLENSGEIISDSVAVLLSATSQSTITNSGLISGETRSVSADSGSVSLVNDGTLVGHVVLNDEADNVENFGTIEGNVLLGGGNDVFTFGSSSIVTGIIDGGADEDALLVAVSDGESFLVDDEFLAGFENFESFEKVGEGTLSFMASTSFGVLEANDGVLAVDSSFTGDIRVGVDGILGGSGTILGNVFSMGVINAGNSPGTLTVDGDVTFATGSVFEVEFAVDTADLLLVSGVATIEDDVTLLLTPEGDNIFGVFSHEVLRADGGIVGDFATISAPNFAIVDRRFEGNSLFLDFITQLGAGIALDTQSTVVADYLNDRLVAGANPATLDVFVDLVTLPTNQLNSALGDLHPESYAASSSLSATSSLGVVDALRDQLVVGRGAEKGHIDLWASGLADFGDQDGQGATSGFDTDSYGVVVGLSYGLSDSVSVGALVGYQNIDQDFDGVRAETEADNVFFGTYASAGFGKLNVDAAFIYHTADVETSRTITVLNDTAFGDYDVDTLTLSGRVGYEAFANDGWLIEPYAGLTYINSDRDDVTEVGAQGASLFVTGEETDFTFLDLGTRVVGQWADGKLQPFVDLAWRYDLSNDGNGATARFINESATFRVQGADVERSRAHVGAGLTGHITEKLKAYVTYGGDFGSDLTNHAVRTGVRYSF